MCVCVSVCVEGGYTTILMRVRGMAALHVVAQQFAYAAAAVWKKKAGKNFLLAAHTHTHMRLNLLAQNMYAKIDCNTLNSKPRLTTPTLTPTHACNLKFDIKAN